MKWKPLHFSFSVSLLVHAILLALIFGLAVGLRPPEPEANQPAAILTLIAAPPDIDAAPATVVPPREIPPPPEVNSPEPPAPERVPEPVVVAATSATSEQSSTTSAPAPPPAPPAGDGSSVKPGADATTQTSAPDVKAQPDYLKNPEPPYPALARRRRQEGLVLLWLTVGSDGQPRNVTVKQSSGHPLLDEAALHAVTNWKFTPAHIREKAVESEIEIPVRFQLTD